MSEQDQDEPEFTCEGCGQPIEDQDRVYHGIDGTLLHAACCGPERDAYHNADDEPLQPGHPIPRPFIYTAGGARMNKISDAENDDLSVDRFAHAMKAKLAKARKKGRGGWDDPKQCAPETLRRMLREHVAKGDPVDIANCAMMLHQRGLSCAHDPAEDFEKADFYWRTLDPDDSGGTAEEAVDRSGVGHYCVCEIGSSYTGPVRYGFTAPVLARDSDETEFLHFATQADALEAAKIRRAKILDRTAARDLSDQQLREQIQRIDARIAEGFGEHGGSPGEWWYERADELGAEAKRRWSEGHTHG